MPVHHVTFDALDPYAIAGFWVEVLDGRRSDDDFPGDPGAVVLHSGTTLLFEQVPDAKTTVKNRVHLDLVPERPREQEVQRLVALGATVVADRVRDDGSGWVVMADPEGNEFCVERSLAERGQEPVSTPDRPLPQGTHTADERTMLLTMLDWYRTGVLDKVAAAPGATVTPLRSGTTVAGLVKHLAYVEDAWFTEVVASRPLPGPWDAAPFDDDPDWEFHSAHDLDEAVALYRQACERSRAVVAEHDLDEVFGTRRRDVSLRFVLLHMVEETARHLGHLDVLRELADGTTGE